MLTKRWIATFVTVMAILSLLAACSPAPTPEVIEKIVKETVVVKEEVEVEVTKVVEVEKEVEVEVTVEVEVPVGAELVHLVARCKGGPHELGRCNNLVSAVGAANAALAEAGDDRRIEVETIIDDKDWGEYKTEFEFASDTGEAPDIIMSGHEDLGVWVPAGLVIPVDDMLGAHPEFDDVLDSLWNSAMFAGQLWGVPQDAEARPMYYSKPLLRELGWSDEEIESLPDRVAGGEFTWEDMIDAATQAVEQGVVEPGNGWWHRPRNGPDFLYYYYADGGTITVEGDDRLYLDKHHALGVYELLYDAAQTRQILEPSLWGLEWSEWHQFVSPAENVLFWFGGSWNWADWAANFVADLGGEDYLWDNIGFAPIPALPGGTNQPITLTHPLIYMISSHSEHPDLALLLIAKATTKELNTPYAIESGHLGILKSQADYAPYTSAKFLSQVLPMLEFTTFLPNSPFWSRWSEAYFMGIQAVEAGELTPEDAVDFVVDTMQNELGDNVVIRD